MATWIATQCDVFSSRCRLRWASEGLAKLQRVCPIALPHDTSTHAICPPNMWAHVVEHKLPNVSYIEFQISFLLEVEHSQLGFHLLEISLRHKYQSTTHETFEMSFKCDDAHIPTCMFDNKTKLLSHMCTHMLHIEKLGQQDAWRC